VQDILDVKVDVLANGSVVGSSDTVNLQPDANGFFTVFVHNVDPSLLVTSNTGYELVFSTGNGAYEVLRLPLTSVPFAKALKGPAGTDNLIAAKGNIGIGTTAPAYKLDVTGDAHFTSSVTASKFYGDGSALTGITVSTITMLNGSIAIIPSGTGGSNNNYAISIGSDAYSNYDRGVGVGYSAYNNYDDGVGVGYQAHDNYLSGVGVGDGSSWNVDYGVGVGPFTVYNYNFGVGIGGDASYNYNSGVGIGGDAMYNYGYGVGVGYFARNNYSYGVGVGAEAAGNSNYAVGIGAYSRNNKPYGSALGTYSYAASSSVAMGSYSKANANNSVAIGAGTINNSTGTVSFGSYAILTSSNITAAKYYGDGSNLTGIGASAGDNLGNHTATMDLVMANFNIGGANLVSGGSAVFANGATAASFTATGAALGVDTAKVRFTDSNIILSSASPSQSGGLYASTHVYVNGDLRATKLYGDVSNATGFPAGDNLGNHTATASLNMANNQKTWALAKTDPLMLIRSEPVLAAGFLVGGGAAGQAVSRMAGLSARAGKPSLGARRLTASFGNTMVRHF